MSSFDMRDLSFLAISTFDINEDLVDMRILSREGGAWHIWNPAIDKESPEDVIFFPSSFLDEIRGESGAGVIVEMEALEIDLPPGVGPLTDQNAVFIADFLERTTLPDDDRLTVRTQALEGAKKQAVPGALRAKVRPDDPVLVATEGERRREFNDGPGAQGLTGPTGGELAAAQEEAAGALDGGSTPAPIVKALPWLGAAALLAGLTWATLRK